MIIEQALMPQISLLDPIEKQIMITMQIVILKNKVEIARSINSMTFACGQMDELMKFLGKDSGPEIDYAKAIWSQNKE